MSDNAKWQLAFWVMASVCLGGLFFLGKEAIAIDSRARIAVESVDSKSFSRFTENRMSILQLMKENSEAHTKILIELEAIKTAVNNGKPDSVRV